MPNPSFRELAPHLAALGYWEDAQGRIRLPLRSQDGLLPAIVRQSTRRQHPEEDQQRALILWRDKVGVPQEPLLALLYHTPNGKQRGKAVGGQLKAMGTKRGVWDLFLPVARRGYHGYWQELKVPGEGLSPEQEDWGRAMRAEGYYTSLHVSWLDSARQWCWYLGRLDMVLALGGLGP